MGIAYRPFSPVDPPDIVTQLSDSARLTHNHPLSVAGAVFVGLLVGDLLLGVDPIAAVDGATAEIDRHPGAAPLVNLLEKARSLAHTAPVEMARRVLGTSAAIEETLPLAVYCFLRNVDSFRDTVLCAANSFRSSTDQERLALDALSPAQALIEAKGGNTDGIAALAGAFSGAHLGRRAIPEEYHGVEEHDHLVGLGRMLAHVLPTS
jgi:ADP-ribosylglycohydrolase